MARRQQLTEAQVEALYNPPADPREIVRHHTLTAADLALARACRGDHNRLGYALMLCYLRYPGRPLRPGERPPASLVASVAEQVDVLPEALDTYLAAERTCRRHAAEAQERLGVRPYGPRPAADLARWLVGPAMEDDRLAHLAALALEECRRRRVAIPSPPTLGRLCLDARHQARQEVYRRLADTLSAEQRRRLDGLTGRRGDTGQSWLAWLRQMPDAAKPTAMLELLARLDHVRQLGIEPAHGQGVHQARVAQLAREAGRSTVQHIAGLERRRRQATLVATALDLGATLTDRAADLFDRLVAAMFRKNEARQARAFQADGRAINAVVRLFAKVGDALVGARDGQGDAFAALDAAISWERFKAGVAQAHGLARSEEFDPYDRLPEHYAGMRRWAPAFLEAFAFKGVPATAPLLRAIEALRAVNRSGATDLPASAPTAFVRPRWVRHVLKGQRLDRRYYEFCVLAELRDRLRAGDVWISGSRQYRSFDEGLLAPAVFADLRRAGTLPLAVDLSFDGFLEARRALLGSRLAAIDAKAREGALPDVSLENGVLRITPVAKSTPPEALALADRLYGLLPRVRITDLLAEVDRWTGFTDSFTHLRTGEPVANRQVLMTALLADGLNLGLTRMAEACAIASLGQLAWTADWHVREETYAQALRCLVGRQRLEPLAALFGAGTASSSDGQFFRAGGAGRDAARLNAHYGQEPGIKFYTHVSDRYVPFATKVIPATASEAQHVLDALFDPEGRALSTRHHTDGGGVSENVFALFSLFGLRFAPRIPDLRDRRLYSFEKPATYPALAPMIAARLDVGLVRAHWDEILRIATSIRTGTVPASLILRQLAAFPRQNGVAAALQELGRLERTLYTLDWLEQPDLRRQASQELNKGETRNSLARAVFLHRLGEIRDRTYENQQHRASGLNLLVTAIILWNTRYLAPAIAALRTVETVADPLLSHLSPLGWEHVNLTGDYVWGTAETPSENRHGLRPLRGLPVPLPIAA